MDEDIRKKKFNVYGDFSEQGASFTEQNGRYPAQAEFEKLIFLDVQKKLKLSPSNHLLDIGCGMGNILIPASFIVDQVTGIDHPRVIEQLNGVIKRDNINLIGTDFLDAPLSGTFDRIVSYCVLPALPDRETVYSFIDKALDLLSDDGLLLLGDISNIDKKKRFLNSRRGQAFSKDWEERMHKMPLKIDTSKASELPSAIFDDDFMLELCMHARQKNFNAYILNQEQSLPFGNTREDILITGPEYDDGTSALVNWEESFG